MSPSRKRIIALHETAYQLAQDHARTCHECYHPIVDEEGNFGYLGEACHQGREILKAYMAAENAVMRQNWGRS